MSELNDVLTKVGLNENELKIYNVIVGFGFRTIGQISTYTGLDLNAISESCSSLMDKNFLLKSKGVNELGDLYIPLSPKISISGDISKRLSEKLNQLSANVSELWNNTQGIIDNDTKELIMTIQNVLGSFSKTLLQTSEDHSISITNWSSDLKDELNLIGEESYEVFKSEVSTPLNELSVKLKELADTLITTSDSSIGEINAKTDLHKKSIENAVKSIKKELEEFADEIGFILNGRLSALNQGLEDLASNKSDDGTAIISDIQNGMIKAIVDEEERIAKINTENAFEYKKMFDDSFDNLNQATDEIGNIFDKTIKEAINTGVQAKNDAIKGSEKLLNKYKEAQIGSVEELQSSLIGAIQTVQKEAVTELTDILAETSNQLLSLEGSITDNLKSHQKQLDGDLKKLTNDVSKSISIRFTEVEKKLKGFIADLKNTSQGNVDSIVQSIGDLNNFLQEFLGGVNGSLSEHLDKLNKNVNEEVQEIVDGTNKNIKTSFKKNTDQIQAISAKIKGDLEEFQNKIRDFLIDTKTNLQNQLEDAQELFNEGVTKGISSYQEEADKVSKHQEQQLTEIDDEVRKLLELADKSRSDVSSLAENTLTSIKEKNLESVKQSIEEIVDKFNKQFSSFNDTLNLDLSQFYEDFQDKSTGLRERVPEEIDTTFSDQIDRLQKFSTDFERISGFIDQTMTRLEEAFQKGSKVNLKKEKENFYQEIIRNKDEFARLDKSISTHFKSSKNDLEMTKNDLLDEFNRTIQDELQELSDLIEVKSKDTNALMSSFNDKMNANKSTIYEEISIDLDEMVNNIKSSLNNQLLSIFQQPLDAILSKAKSTATGTEGVDQENRIIKSQKILISSIQKAVDTLTVSLKNAFEISIQNLDENVTEAISASDDIVKIVNQELKEELGKQEKSSSKFVSDIAKSLKSVMNSMNNNLTSTIDETKQNVGQTVIEKQGEIQNTVSTKTSELQLATSEKLIEVDNSFKSFKNDFKAISDEASKGIKKTVNSTLKIQQKSMKETLTSLSSTTKFATDSITATQNSLHEKVGTPLAMTESEVNGMVEAFGVSSLSATEMLGKEVSGYYQKSLDQLSSLEKLNKKISSSSKKFKNTVNGIGDKQSQNIQDLKNDLKSEREESMSLFKELLTEKGDKLSSNIEEFIQDSYSSMAEQLSVLQQEVLSSIENVKSNVNLTVTNSVETVRTDILGPVNAVTESLLKERDIIEEKSKSLAIKFDELEENQQSIIGQGKDRFISSVEKSVNREEDKWKQKNEKSYNEQSERLKSLAIEFETKVSDASTEGKQKVTDAFNTIPSTIDETLDAAAKSMALLNEISKGAIKLEPKFPELSYFDASKEAIIANLNSVLAHTKSSATIVSPRLNWIDLSILDKLTRASIRIVTDPSTHLPEDTEIVQHLKNSDVNISLKKLDRNRHNKDMNLIMVNRDVEELILSKLLDSKDPYCFVSQDDAFIEKFGILFRDYATMPNL